MNESEKLASLRRTIGASVFEMADVIGLKGPHRNDRIIEMELGKREPSGTIANLADYIGQGVRLPGAGLANRLLTEIQPAFTVVTGSDGFRGVQHNRQPRFLAVFSALLPLSNNELVDGLREDGMLASPHLETLFPPPESGLGMMIAIKLDKVPGSIRELMKRAVEVFQASPEEGGIA
jgi:hypothetical protein